MMWLKRGLLALLLALALGAAMNVWPSSGGWSNISGVQVAGSKAAETFGRESP